MSSEEVSEIQTILRGFPQVEKAMIFGSRSKGNFQKGSDVDIALWGEQIDTVLWKIHDQLEEETLMPYFFDVLDFASITNPELREHIERAGQIIYQKTA